MISKVYNSEKLKQDNEDYKIKIQSFKDENTNHQNDLILVQDRIIKGQEYRDGLLKSKHTDIDKEITLLSPDKVTGEILSLETQKKGVQKQLEEIKVIEPSSYYHEDEHDLIKEETKKTFQQKVEVETKIKSIEELKSSVSGGIKCEHCGIELMNAAITNSKISQLDGFIVHKTQLLGLMQDLTNKEQAFVQLKKEFDEYEKNKLIKEKHELNIESLDMKISNLQDKLSKYNELQDKIKENEKTETLIIKAGLKLDELESEKTNLSRKIDTNNFQIKSFDDKIENNNKLIQKISEEYEKEKIYKVYLDIFGKNGISKIIMKTMMPLINSELQRLLEDSSHFRLEVRINDKNEVEFIMIDNNTQVEKLMASGSGYERTIASLALRAVLSKISSLPKPNIIVFDEVFGKISNENLDMVGEFFIKIKNYFEKIFVITHNPLVSNWADNVVKISKENNISSVKQ
jgi:exonuclease SbcC